MIAEANNIDNPPCQRIDPNQSLQATGGDLRFNNVCGVSVGFGLSDVFRQTPAAPELGLLGSHESQNSGFMVW